MKKPFLLLLLFFITFGSCEEDLINSSIPEKEYTSINTKTNSSELIKFEKLESDLRSYKSFKLSKKSSNSNVLYRKIVNTENNTVTYTLPLAIYTTETPYYLIQQIIKNDNDIVVQHLKIIPDSKPTNPNTDILGALTGRVELLDENLQFISSTKYQDGKAVKKDPSVQSKTSITCYTFTETIEVKCTNGGNHGVGQSCNAGYTNDAYYITTSYDVCYGGGDWFSQGGGYNSGDVGGGYIYDYQLNSILTNPTFKYADYIVDPSHSLLLQAIRQWIPNNISDLNGDLSTLNDRVKIFVDNEQMFYDLETYNQNTNNPRLPNMEVADYSVRVYEMFKFLLSYPTLENGLAAKYSIAYLDKNRMISWEDFFMTFKGIGKIMINNPEISKEQLLNWMSWYDKYKQTRPNVKTYFNQNPQDFDLIFYTDIDYSNTEDIEFVNTSTNTIVDLLINNKNNTLSNLDYSWPNLDSLKQKVKNAISKGIYTTAKYTRDYLYIPMVKVGEKYPSTIYWSNKGIDKIRLEAVTPMVNFNENTMSWSDLFNIWLFELTPNKYANNIINFTNSSNIINGNNLYNPATNAVKNFPKGDWNDTSVNPPLFVPYLDKLKSSLQNGTLTTASTLSGYFNYNTNAFYATVFQQQNLGIQMLGSFPITGKVLSKTSHSAIMQFTISNDLGWESGTRFIKGQNGGGNQGVIDNKDVGDGLHLGGTITNIFIWTETVDF